MPTISPISGRTQLTGLIGWPVSHSLSPVMHQAAAAELGLDLVYLPLPVRPDQLPASVAGLAALGFRGVNVTIPHKETVIPLLDQIEPAAELIGAVNTIVFQRAAETVQALGYNTDWSGFLADLQQRFSVDDGMLANEKCLVLGAGGSARAVAYALATCQAQVHLFARRLPQAQQIVRDLAPHFPAAALLAHPWNEIAEQIGNNPQPRLIINTTPVGMTPYESQSPWPADLPWPARALVYDLIYNPAQTRFLDQAQAAGCQTANGQGMLVNQGAQAFALWTQKRPDTAIMAAALQKASA